MSTLPDTNSKSIRISAINTSAGTQIRAKINLETVDQYAEAMQDGAKFPPVELFQHGEDYILADGFHRVLAAQRCGFLDILASVNDGDKSQALAFALSANTEHGLRLTNADKRRSVELALQQWPDKSSRDIANICNVSKTFVESHRRQLATVASSPERTGKDGKKRRLPTKRKKPERQEEPEPPRVRTADEIAAGETAVEPEPRKKGGSFLGKQGLLLSLKMSADTVQDVARHQYPFARDLEVLKLLQKISSTAHRAHEALRSEFNPAEVSK